MTVKEFYNWAKKEGFKDFEIYIQFRDDGGYYTGCEPLEIMNTVVDRDMKELTI